MKLSGVGFCLIACAGLLLAGGLLFGARVGAVGASAAPKPPKGSWYFAVSGDSRDCGDLVMPKIARAVRARQATTPAAFYWHLGDFRALWRVDCDIATRDNPAFDCLPEHRTAERLAQEFTPEQKAAYQATAWDDFIARQISPFESADAATAPVPFVAGIGNHELIQHTRDDFRLRFQKWLTQPLLAAQVKADARRGVNSPAGETYFHFIRGGVDFIYLDNASNAAFSPEQVAWLARVLAADARDRSVKTIIAGMHAALPFSASRNHAMDASCAGICSGQTVYNMLYDAQNLSAPASRRKHVYVMASHSHYFEQNIYDTPEHLGRVLPGWIIGTAGAEQYRDTIRYGYLQVEVRPDGTIDPQFVEVTRDSPPEADGANAQALADFCFARNKSGVRDDSKKNCSCNGPMAAPTPAPSPAPGH